MTGTTDETTARDIAAARTRLHAAGIAATDLDDAAILAGKRVWWGREDDWAKVVRPCPVIADAIVRWMARPGIPTDLTIGVRVEPGPGTGTIEVSLGRGDATDLTALAVSWEAGHEGWLSYPVSELPGMITERLDQGFIRVSLAGAVDPASVA